MTVDLGQATLVAALVAAIASIFTLVINIRAASSAEMRLAHRQALEKYVHELSGAIHSTIATANILTKAKTEPALQNWRDRADEAQAKLKELRILLRYQLWGITDAIGTLSRLPDWVENSRRFPEHSQKVFSKGRALGRHIDIAIRNSYLQGRRPTWLECIKVNYAARQLETTYAKFRADPTLRTKEVETEDPIVD